MTKINVKLSGKIEFPPGAAIDLAVKKVRVGVFDALTMSDLKSPPDALPASGSAGFIKVVSIASLSFDISLTGSAQVEDDHYVYVMCQSTYENAAGTEYVLRHDDPVLLKVRATPGTDSIDIGTFSFEESIICRIQGKVERPFGDNQSVPFEGVQVILLDGAHEKIDQTATDSLGEYCFTTGKTGRLLIKFESERQTTTGPLMLTRNELHVIAEGGHEFQVPTVKYTTVGARIIGRVSDGLRGLKDVPVSAIVRATREVLHPENPSDASGHYEFSLATPGEFELVFPDPFVDESTGKIWELRSGQSAVQVVSVVAGQILMAEDVQYAPEEHKIVWTVTSMGYPAAGKLVEVLNQADKKFIAQQRTGPDGQAVFLLAEPGEYIVRVYPDDPASIGPYEYTTSVHSTFQGRSDFAPPAPRIADSGGAAANAELSEAVVDSQAYPILTESVGLTPTVVPSAPSTGGGAPLAQTAEKAIRAVLGWRPKAGDIQGFKVALQQSFALKDFEGHTEATWTPRSYAIQVQDDLGAITGAQASIYTRAKAALDASLPLLDGLYTLTTQVQQDYIEATRAIVRSEMTQLVTELGVVGGPRVQRVDELFRFLLGPTPSADPENVGGHLEELGERLGMERELVNTVEDEQNYTNYLILVEYIYTLNVSWENQRKFFDRTGAAEPFLGTQLVLVSQALTAIAEGVQQAYFTMDSVFLSSAERQTISLNFAGDRLGVLQVPGDTDAAQVGNTFTFDRNAASMTIAELLDWVDRVASEEAPRLIQDAGKDGVIAFFPTINKLRKLVHGALIVAAGGVQDPNRQPLPAAYSTARVQRALAELASQLDDTARLAGQITSQARQPRTDLTKQALVDALRDPDVVSALRSVVGSGRSGGTPTAPPSTGASDQDAGGIRPPGPGHKFDPSLFDKFDIEVLRGARPDLFTVTTNTRRSIFGGLT